MAAEYPAAIKTFSANVNLSTAVNAAYMNQRDQEITAIETALGIYPYGGAIGMFQSLPALRAFWPFSSVPYDGAVNDISANGNHLLVPGSAIYIKLLNDLTPYADLDGTSDHYFDSTDASGSAHTSAMIDTSITGFTIGCWIYLNGTSADYFFMSQADGATAAGTNWQLYNSALMLAKFAIFDGSSAYEVEGPELNANQWYFVVGKYEPSTRLSITVNGVKYSNTTSIPATVNANALATQVGAQAGANLLDGRFTLGFMCGCALPDTLISALFSQTRGRFGV